MAVVKAGTNIAVLEISEEGTLDILATQSFHTGRTTFIAKDAGVKVAKKRAQNTTGVSI